jgi:hypothetical protein
MMKNEHNDFISLKDVFCYVLRISTVYLCLKILSMKSQTRLHGIQSKELQNIFELIDDVYKMEL